MNNLIIGLAGQSVSLSYPDSVADVVAFLFGRHAVAGGRARHDITITQTGQDAYLLRSPLQPPSPRLTAADVPEFAMEAVIRGLVMDESQGVMLHAGALRRRDKAILVAGVSGAGKSTLTAWMASNGFSYLTDEIVFLPTASPLAIVPFTRPMTLRADSLKVLDAEGVIAEGRARLLHGDKALIAPADEDPARPPEVGAILFPRYARDAELAVEPLSAGSSALRLLENNLNGKNLPDGGLATLVRLANAAPAFRLTYGDFAQIEGVLERIVDDILDGGMDAKAWYGLYSAFGSKAGAASDETPVPTAAMTTVPARPINPPTPVQEKRFRLTVGMATYDDFDGVYFSVQALRLNNPGLMDDIEILVIDNHPDGPCGDALKALEGACPTYRYVPFTGQSGTAVRDLVFAEARGDFVLCMDCHVLLAPGVLERLLDFLDRNPESTDLYQGPMLYDSLQQVSTQFDPVWQQGMFGVWGTDKRAENPDAAPFEIPMQGLGLFVSRRETWPGFNTKFRGFGGEEGYIHEKFRQRGGKTLCLPFLRWLHRFPRPMGVPYAVKWEDRIRNYTIGHRELGLPEEPMVEHFRELLGQEPADRIIEEVRTELANPFNRFDSIALINLDDRLDRREQMNRRFVSLGIDRLVRRFSAVRTPENHHIGCALSHRAIVADAKRRGLKNVLVFEDDAIFHREALRLLPAMLDQLESTDWDLFYLGGHVWNRTFDLLPGGSSLRDAKKVTTTHAIAYNHTVYDRVLADVPADPEGVERWLETARGIDQYYFRLDVRKVLAEPMLSLQTELTGQGPAVDPANYSR